MDVEIGLTEKIMKTDKGDRRVKMVVMTTRNHQDGEFCQVHILRSEDARVIAQSLLDGADQCDKLVSIASRMPGKT